MLAYWLTLIGCVALPAIACNSQVDEPPLYWLASLRNGTGTVTPDTARLIPGHRLIRFEKGATPIPVTPSEKYELERSGLRFYDVTEDDLELVAARTAQTNSDSRAIPVSPLRQSTVRPILATLSQSNLQSDLAELTRYRTRYYKSQTGKAAANDLVAKLKRIASSAGDRVTVRSFTHQNFGMPSVIAHIKGTNDDGPITIVGAHLDSINQANPDSGAAPGADDDGSGCVNLIESFRKLVASSFRPTNPIEFHWYAGEEGGLLGSAAIANKYNQSGKSINAMMNLDMTAWLQTGTTPQIGFVSDHTNPALTAFTKTLVTEYLSGVVPTDDFCGYACSDHSSWDELGYPAVYPFESITELENPNIHSAQDTSNKPEFSFSHMHEFTKLATAFVVELSF